MAEAAPRWDVLYDADAIAGAVSRLAAEIRRDLGGREALAVPVLNGALFFAADLLRALGEDVRVAGFCAAVVSSYALSPDGTDGPLDAPRVTSFPGEALVRGRAVVVVDTVVDTGATAKAVLDRARACGAASTHLACLVDKPARRRVAVRPDWAGFSGPDRFLVGYGLDSGGRYRTLPFVAALVP